MRTGLIIIAFMFTSVVLRAEKYLSVEQARKLAFPNATRFEEQVLRFSAEQRKAIEKKSGVPVKVEGNKVTFAYEGARLAGVLFVDGPPGDKVVDRDGADHRFVGTERDEDMLLYRLSGASGDPFFFRQAARIIVLSLAEHERLPAALR